MKILIPFFIISSSFLYHVFGQQSFIEAGVFGGFSFYKGEIDPTPLLGHINTYPAAGGIIRCQFTPNIALRLSGIAGKIADYDKDSKIYEIYNRNLSFQSSLVEGSLLFEYNFLKFQPAQKKIFSPYLFGGIGVFHFNPKAEYMGELVELQPLGTEGQGTTQYPDRKPYSLTNIAFPFGIGMKIAISSKLSLGLEFGWRFTGTDYLDDVSTTYVDPAILSTENGNLAEHMSNRFITQPASLIIDGQYRVRGDGKTHDWYYFSGLTVTYQLKSSNKDFHTMITTRKVKCPFYY